jgi:hypothetical protein
MSKTHWPLHLHILITNVWILLATEALHLTRSKNVNAFMNEYAHFMLVTQLCIWNGENGRISLFLPVPLILELATKLVTKFWF